MIARLIFNFFLEYVAFVSILVLQYWSAALCRSFERLIKTVINVVCPPRIILNHFHLMDPWLFPPLRGGTQALVWKICEQWWSCYEQDWHEAFIPRRDFKEPMLMSAQMLIFRLHFLKNTTGRTHWWLIRMQAETVVCCNERFQYSPTGCQRKPVKISE